MLTRFARALRRQDWFTVLLEIVIVVLGIVIALQADEWRETRKLKQLEAEYLVALGDDMEVMAEDLALRLVQASFRRDAMVRGFLALEACDDSPAARADVKLGLDQYQVSQGIVYVGATYEEMVASGALARMDDGELKRAIASTYSALADLEESIRGIRVSMPVVDAILWSRVDYGIDERRRFDARVDIPALCQSREIRNAFLEMIDIQADSSGFMGNVQRRVNDLLQRLGRPIPPEPVLD